MDYLVKTQFNNIVVGYIVGSLVHSAWLNVSFSLHCHCHCHCRHYSTFILFPLLYGLFLFIWRLRINLHQVGLYVLLCRCRHSKSPHSLSLLFLISSFHLYIFLFHISFHLCEEIVSYRIISYHIISYHISYHIISYRSSTDELNRNQILILLQQSDGVMISGSAWGDSSNVQQRQFVVSAHHQSINCVKTIIYHVEVVRV